MRRLLLLTTLAGLLYVVVACAARPPMPTPTAIALQETATSWPLPTRPAVAETRTPPPTQAATEPPPSFPGSTLDELTQLDDRLAQRTAESFVERLKKGKAASAFRLLLTEEAQQGETGQWVMQFTGADFNLVDAALLDLRRATATSYEARAMIRWIGTDQRGPAVQAMTLTLAYQRGLWLIDHITLGDFQAVSATATPRRAITSAPKTPQLERRLVFQPSSGGPIYLINADSSELRRLTDGLDPAWSPDGEAIAFLSDRDGAWRMYVMEADGSSQRAMFGDKLDGLGIRYEWATERVVSWSR